MYEKNDGLFFKPNSDWRGNAYLNTRKADVLAYILGYKQAADFLVEKVVQDLINKAVSIQM